MHARLLRLAARAMLVSTVLFLTAYPGSVFALQRQALTLVISDSAIDYTETACQRFGAAHNVDVELIPLPGGTQDRIEFLTTRYLGGIEMDVTHLNPEITGGLTSLGLLTDLRAYLERDPSINLKDFIPTTLASYSYPSGALYAIPMDVVMRSFMANLDLLHEAGLGNPNDLDPTDWTWDRLASYGRRLTKVSAAGDITQSGFAWGESHVNTIVHQGGGYLFDHPTTPTQSGVLMPETVAALETWAGWFYPNPIAVRSGKIHTHKVALSIQTSSDVLRVLESNVLFNWDIVRYPKGRANNASVETISAFAMVESTKQPALAWELLKFLVTDKQMAKDLIQIRSRPPSYIPNLSLYVRDSFPPGTPPGMHVYREVLLHPEFRGKLSFPGADRFVEELEKALRYDGITGQKPIRSILEDFSRRAQLTLSALK